MTSRRLKSEERRKQILEKAAEVFAAHGLAGARTKDIAKACDINEAVIYKHFESKEELFRESLHFNQIELVEKLYELVESESDGLKALRASMGTHIAQLIADPALRAYMLHGIAASTHDVQMNAWASDWFGKQNEFIRKQLKRGIEDGSIRPDIDIENEVWHIKGVGLASMLAGIFGLSEKKASDLARDLFKKVLDSIAAY